VQLLRAHPEPDTDVGHGLRPVDLVKADDVAVEAARVVDAAGRGENLDVVELQRLEVPAQRLLALYSGKYARSQAEAWHGITLLFEARDCHGEPARAL
jgi:hypothetical protein